MKSNVKKILANIAVNICKESAESLASSACITAHFQPKEPKCIKKEE